MTVNSGPVWHLARSDTSCWTQSLLLFLHDVDSPRVRFHLLSTFPIQELDQVALVSHHGLSAAIGSTWRGLAALRPPTPTAIAGASPALRPPRHCRHFGRHAIAGSSAVLAGISVATPSPALRPSSQAFRSPRPRRHFGRPRRHFGRRPPPASHRRRFGSHRRRHIAGASPATAGASHRRRAPWL